MKSRVIILTVLTLMAGAPVAAQYSDMYYHQVGDTVEMRSPIGYYSWWEWENYYSSTRRLKLYTSLGAPTSDYDGRTFWNENVSYQHNFERMQLFYTPVPLKIVGVADALFSETRDSAYPYLPITVEPDYQEYLRVYEATPQGHPLMAQAAWHLSDPCRYLRLRGHAPSDGPEPSGCSSNNCCCYEPWTRIIPLHEYYFDTAVYVMDSFYVGGTMFSRGEKRMESTTEYWSVWTYGGHISCAQENTIGYDGQCAISGFTYMFRWEGETDWRWNHVDNITDTALFPFVEIIFPIVQVDTTVPPEGSCVPVENVQVMPMADSSALVTWDGFPNYTAFDVAYGPLNLESQWPVVRVGDSLMYCIRDIDPLFPYYGVKVRAICDDEESPTPWSSRAVFQPAVEPDTVGINGSATILSRLVTLAPNPASDAVTVTSSFSLRHIDIYNMSGLLVYSEPVGGHQAMVQLKDFRPGTYLMEISTFGGTTHKKFIKSK